MNGSLRRVTISKPFFRGVYHEVGHLDAVLHHSYLGAMVRAGQVIVSRDGTRVAFVRRRADSMLEVVMGDGTVLPAIFVECVSETSEIRPRILDILHEDVLVAGTLPDGRTGVFSCSRNNVEQLSVDGELIGTQNTGSGLLLFVRTFGNSREQRRLIIPSLGSDLPIHANALVTGFSGKRVMVFEPIERMFYRYSIGPDGLQDFFSAPLLEGEQPVGLVRWQGMYLLGVRGQISSELRGFGKESVSLSDRRIRLDGVLECVWQSPSQESAAWLYRTTEKRVLVVNNEILFQGSFSMGARDLVWSLNGKNAGARVHVREIGKGPIILIGHNGKIHVRQGQKIDAFCVDNEGEISAWIENDGRFHRPYVYMHPHDAVEYAWNLTTTRAGSIRYNCVLGDMVFNLIDHTHINNTRACS